MTYTWGSILWAVPWSVQIRCIFAYARVFKINYCNKYYNVLCHILYMKMFVLIWLVWVNITNLVCVE